MKADTVFITPLYRELATLMDSAVFCSRPGASDTERKWRTRHLERAAMLVDHYLPTDSNDMRVALAERDSHGECLIFVGFLKRSEGYVHFTLIVKPSLMRDLNLEFRSDLQADEEYASFVIEVMTNALRQELDVHMFYNWKGL